MILSIYGTLLHWNQKKSYQILPENIFSCFQKEIITKFDLHIELFVEEIRGSVILLWRGIQQCNNSVKF